MKYIEVPFPSKEYSQERYKKYQIVLHHTVSNPNNSLADINYWKGDNKRIGTFCIIDGNGNIYKCFDPGCWAYHLGVKGDVNLEKHTIGIELDNLGGLSYQEGKFYNAYGQVVSVKEEEIMVFDKGWRGFNYFQKYTQKQLDSLKELLILLGEQFSIPLIYREDMWDVTSKALNLDEGVFTHVSYRKDKSDCFPQYELIDMLKSL